MQPLKPHWAWFLAGPAVFVLGLAAAVIVLVGGTLSVGSDMQRVPVPGEGTVRIATAGDSTIFYEQAGAAQAEIPEGLSVVITPVSGGEPLALTSTSGRFSYKTGSIAGRNFRNVTYPHAGEYHVVTSLPEGSPVTGRVAVGGNPGGEVLTTLVWFFGLATGSFLVGVMAILIVAIMRSRHRKQLEGMAG